MTPPKPLPTRGRGLICRTPFANTLAFRQEFGGAIQGPSPLWGGVGEGTLPKRIGPVYRPPITPI
ncbi:hypothetical protein EHI48_14615 [Rhizobium sp. WSM1325]|nr:hypothetical protein EHI46_11930 [Rhizobium leguminosarum]RWY77222.1 hypothetical protein EHI48_14615 [Rhizobium leguminosarum]